MSDQSPIEPMSGNEATEELQGRRDFLMGLGKWSGAAIFAAVAGGVFPGSTERAFAGGWVNRGGSWVNRRGGGGWVNRHGGGGWLNRYYGGGVGAWANGGATWVNRRYGLGGWLNGR